MSGVDVRELKESTPSVIGDGYCCKGANGDGVAGTVWAKDDGVDGVRGEGRRRVTEPVFCRAWGQLLTRPDGLL